MPQGCNTFKPLLFFHFAIFEAFTCRTNLVSRAINTVKTNLLEAALIVIFVLIIFLGNLRAGLIVASAIPLSMLFALGMMRL
ncbi:MAG TPA: efflux RND transporter permease subunit, partial [Ferruginibacter sp.]|nr:efflux RND transporter permease subunit [Ferruginibacter sp.]